MAWILRQLPLPFAVAEICLWLLIRIFFDIYEPRSVDEGKVEVHAGTRPSRLTSQQQNHVSELAGCDRHSAAL